MQRFAKWLGIVVLALVALVIVFVVGVLVFVDPNDYRDEIAQVVEQRTGRELAIEGDLELTFFPWFGLEASNVRLADAEGFGPDPFVAVEQLQLAVKVLPLLRGELMLDTIILDRPQIHLIRNQQGLGNWETMGAPQGAATSPPAAPEAPSTSDTEATPPPSGGDPAGVPPILRNTTLEGFIVNDARLVWEDRRSGTTVVADPFNLTLEDVRLGSEIPLRADWEVALADGPTVTGSLSALATVAPDLATATVTDIDLEATAAGEAVPGGEQSAQITGRIDANLDAGFYRVSELVLQAAGLTAEAEAQARLTDAGTTARGSLVVPKFSPRNLFEQLGIEPPETEDPAVLQAASLEAQFRYGADGALSVEPLRATLDDSTLTGTVTVRDFSTPSAAFDLTVDEINVDRYLPRESAGETPPPETPSAGSGAAGKEGLPLEPLRGLALDGQLHVGELTVAGARMTDAELTVSAENGRIRVHPLTASLYGGRYQGDIRLDATGETLAVSLNESLAGIQAQPLLSDVVEFDRLLGSGSFSINATTRGTAPGDFLKALTGEATFLFEDGMVKGINVAQVIRAALAKLKGEPVPETDAPLQTDYGKLGGTLHFDGGTVRNDDLSVQTPLLRIGGEGTVDLIERTLDYDLTVNVVGTLEGQGGEGLKALRNVPVPLHFDGALADPEISVDMASAVKAVAGERIAEEKAELKQKLEEEKQETKQKLQEKLGEEFKGLFD